jgi:hypothetical protein
LKWLEKQWRHFDLEASVYDDESAPKDRQVLTAQGPGLGFEPDPDATSTYLSAYHNQAPVRAKAEPCSKAQGSQSKVIRSPGPSIGNRDGPPGRTRGRARV